MGFQLPNLNWLAVNPGFLNHLSSRLTIAIIVCIVGGFWDDFFQKEMGFEFDFFFELCIIDLRSGGRTQGSERDKNVGKLVYKCL